MQRRISVEPFFGFATFVVAFQFGAIATSLLVTNLLINCLVGCVVGAAATALLKITHHGRTDVGANSLAIYAIAAAVFSVLLLARANFGLSDMKCPTNTLGMIHQISAGQLPAHFIGYPEFVANYHQGFLLIAGLLAKITGQSYLALLLSTLLLSLFSYASSRWT